MRQNNLNTERNTISQVSSNRIPCPVMNYQQFRRACRLIREECCNYDNGKCFLLDEGDSCVCVQVQSISYTLLCKWFRAAVLPLDKQLEGEILHSKEMKSCVVCGKPFLPPLHLLQWRELLDFLTIPHFLQFALMPWINFDVLIYASLSSIAAYPELRFSKRF